MAIAVLAVLVIAACLAFLSMLLFFPERGEQWTTGLRPVQFYNDLEADLIGDYADLFAVAHNSGDNLYSTLDAINYGADVIEVDVVSVDGRLYAAHDMPPIWIGETVFRGPPLAQIWAASAGAAAIKLDLKEASPEFHELLFDFLADRQGQRRVIVVSGSANTLRLFAERAPEVLRFYGAGNGDRLALIDDDPEFAAIVDGVTIRDYLIDEERAAWLEERNILTVAWTVNDLQRVNELVALGVDGITTDNLAIVGLLGGRQTGELKLDALRVQVPIGERLESSEDDADGASLTERDASLPLPG
ncbi:MAG: glycerophosphodiester phosphodiesterase [Thermomicrobiales bacterium]